MVVLMDMSNLVYTGMSSRPIDLGDSKEITVTATPYVLARLAAFYSVDKDVVAVFDSTHRGSTLAKTEGYKAGRQFNPAVAWELRVLRELFDLIRVPCIEVHGKEADHVIRNICRDYKGKYDVYIASADADLYANVYSEGGFFCEMLSFSSRSYSISKANFEITTKVPYNFIDLDKILNGCKSDNIKPFPNGKVLFEGYIGLLKRKFARTYGFDPSQHKFSQLKDSVVNSVNTLDAFLEYFEATDYYTPEAVNELRNREELIKGPEFYVRVDGGIDWQLFNKLVKSIGLAGPAEILEEKVMPFDLEYYKKVISIIKDVPINDVTMFEKEETPQVTAVDISSIFSILDQEGDL